MADFFATFHIEGRLLIAQFVNFAIVFALLYFFVIKGLMKLMKGRTETIEKGLTDAKKAETALIMADHEKERILGDGHMEVKNMILSAESRGEEIVELAKVEAEKEAHKKKEMAIKEIEMLRDAQKTEIRDKSVDLVIAGVEAVLKEKIDEKKAEEMIRGLAK